MLRRHGTGAGMPVVVCAPSFTQPPSRSGAQDCDCQTPSIAASLGTWLSVTVLAMLAPKTATWRMATTVKNGSASCMFFFANSTCRPLVRYQALADMTSAAPIIHDAAQTWSSRGMNEAVNTTLAKLVMYARLPHCELCTVKPAGVFIHEFAIRIQSALKWAPNATRNVASSHMRGPSGAPPKRTSARKPPSSKNANMPSPSSCLQETLPTNREYWDQFMPNANSWTMPVAIPSANTRP